MIDKRMLVDFVTIQLEIDKDEWGSPVYGEPFTLSPVRFDRNLETSGDKSIGGNGIREYTKPSVLYVYPEHCNVSADNSWINAKLADEYGEYLVKKVIPHKHPFANKIFSYEIEVI